MVLALGLPRLFYGGLRSGGAVLALLEPLDQEPERPKVHLFERAIGNGMREQILRAPEQVDVFLGSGEGRRAGAVGPILRSVSSGKLANRRPEGFDEAPPAGRTRHGYANEFGTERLDAVEDGRRPTAR